MEVPHSFTPSFLSMEYWPPSCHFLVGFSLSQLIRGSKNDSEAIRMGGLFATKGADGIP